MKLLSILFTGTAKATTGIVATVATAATVVTAATVAYSPTPSIQAEPSAPSAYVENLPEVETHNPVEIETSAAAVPENREDTDSARDSSGTDVVAPQANTAIPQPASAPQPENQPEEVAPVEGNPSVNTAQPVTEDIDRPEAPSSNDSAVQKENTVTSQPEQTAPAPQVKNPPASSNGTASAPVQTNPQPKPAPGTTSSAVQEKDQPVSGDTAVPAPAPVEPEPVYTPEPEPTAPSYQFSYDRTTSVYADDNETLLRVEYYDENNKLTHYSKVEDYDTETHSYTENIYTYDEETGTEILQRTDVYEGDGSSNAE